MDRFFIGWDYVDTFGFSMVVIALVWYLVDRRIGIRLFYILTLSPVVNRLLKDCFGLPRPCQIDPTVGVLCSNSPGMPSGGAQTAALLAGIIFIESKRPLYRWLGVLFALLLSFSRVYLGKHYWSDILGGWIVGGVLLLVYWKLFPKMEKRWKVWLFLFSGLILFIGSSSTIYLFCVSIGVALGLLQHEKREKRTLSQTKQYGQTLIVLIGLSVFYGIGLLYPPLGLFCAFAAGFWLANPLFRAA